MPGALTGRPRCLGASLSPAFGHLVSPDSRPVSVSMFRRPRDAGITETALGGRFRFRVFYRSTCPRWRRKKRRLRFVRAIVRFLSIGRLRTARITAENRLTTYRAARSALSALGPHLLPSSSNSGEIASIRGNRYPLTALSTTASPEAVRTLCPPPSEAWHRHRSPRSEHASRPSTTAIRAEHPRRESQHKMTQSSTGTARSAVLAVRSCLLPPY